MIQTINNFWKHKNFKKTTFSTNILKIYYNSNSLSIINYVLLQFVNRFMINLISKFINKNINFFKFQNLNLHWFLMSLGAF